MGYRLEITRGKKEKDEKVDKASVEDLIGIVGEVSNQLDEVLKEVSVRDEEIIKLEQVVVEKQNVIDSLVEDLNKQIEATNKVEELLVDRENNIRIQHKTISEKTAEILEHIKEIDELKNRIKRLESEAQERYKQNCQLKEELEKAKEENEKLQKKINDILGLLK